MAGFMCLRGANARAGIGKLAKLEENVKKKTNNNQSTNQLPVKGVKTNQKGP